MLKTTKQLIDGKKFIACLPHSPVCESVARYQNSPVALKFGEQTATEVHTVSIHFVGKWNAKRHCRCRCCRHVRPTECLHNKRELEFGWRTENERKRTSNKIIPKQVAMTAIRKLLGTADFNVTTIFLFVHRSPRNYSFFVIFIHFFFHFFPTSFELIIS